MRQDVVQGVPTDKETDLLPFLKGFNGYSPGGQYLALTDLDGYFSSRLVVILCY